MLVSDELAESLSAKRQRVLLELDEKIRRHQENLRQHTLPLDVGKIPPLPGDANVAGPVGNPVDGAEPAAYARRTPPRRGAVCLSERAGEDYEKIEGRIAKSIKGSAGRICSRWAIR